MAKRKNEDVDPVAPPVPQWKPPTEDVEWREWMKDGFWCSGDMRKYGGAQKLSDVFVLPLPVFPALDRASLSKSAAKALDDVISRFAHHLAQSHDAPRIPDLLNEKKKEYLANTKSDGE